MQLPRVAVLRGASFLETPLVLPLASVDVALDARFDYDGLSRLEAARPDVIVLDLRGFEAKTATDAIAQVRQYHSSARIVVAGDAGNQAMAEAAFAAGTSGYVSRDSGPDALLKAVLGAVRGKVKLGRTATHAILRLAGAPAPKAKS